MTMAKRITRKDPFILRDNDPVNCILYRYDQAKKKTLSYNYDKLTKEEEELLRKPDQWMGGYVYMDLENGIDCETKFPTASLTRALRIQAIHYPKTGENNYREVREIFKLTSPEDALALARKLIYMAGIWTNEINKDVEFMSKKREEA